MDIKKKLGNRIREIRIANSLTQEALAERINISAKSLSQIECGNNFVSAETLNDLCLALNISPKTMFDFGLSDADEKDILSDITKRLRKNPGLLRNVYKIVLALDY